MSQYTYGISVGTNNMGEWDQPENRRQGLRNLHRLHRYGSSFRAPKVQQLHMNMDFRLHHLASLRWYMSHPFFSGLSVLKGNEIIFEHYASDFGPKDIHSIQSISKTFVFLIAGQLVEAGLLDMDKAVRDYLPEIGSGYSHATVQQLFDMGVLNNYSEDYSDPNAMLGELEDAHGWRLLPGTQHKNLREFLVTITGKGDANVDLTHHYKTANTDLAAWICERVSGKSLRSLTIDILESAGVEDPVFLSTDREGTAFLGGGLHMTLRDLSRYGLLLANAGHGLGEAAVGSRRFLNHTLEHRKKGTRTALGWSYRNFTFTNGVWMGHLGYGGQWLMVHPKTNMVICGLSATLDNHGLDLEFIRCLMNMGQDIASTLNSRR
jgi:CubicO group peptidase (beta-lactamase class C family)